MSFHPSGNLVGSYSLRTVSIIFLSTSSQNNIFRCVQLEKIINVESGICHLETRSSKQRGTTMQARDTATETVGEYSCVTLTAMSPQQLDSCVTYRCSFGTVFDSPGECRLFTTHIPVIRSKSSPSFITKWETTSYSPVKVVNAGDEVICSLAVSYVHSMHDCIK